MSDQKKKQQSDNCEISAEEPSDSSAIVARELLPTERIETKPGVLHVDMVSAAQPPITWEVVVEHGAAAKTCREENNAESNTRKILTVEEFTELLHQNGIADLRWCSSMMRRSTKLRKSDKEAKEKDAATDVYDQEHNCGLNYILRLGAMGGSLNEEMERIRSMISTEKIVNASPKRYVLGSEIALALIIAAAGATRIRPATEKSALRPQLIPGDSNSQKGESADRIAENPGSAVNHAGIKPVTRPKTIITSTDTLISIAEAFFYDQNLAWLIADLNQKIIKESFLDGKRIVEVKSRQQIELPLREDIDRFYKTKSDHERGENIVTIVEDTVIDSELLNSSLMKLVRPEEE